MCRSAEQVVQVCLGLRQGERLVLIADSAEEEFGAAVFQAATAAGAAISAFIVGSAELVNSAFHSRLTATLATADASVLVCSIEGVPRSFRRHIIQVKGKPRRHAHILGINESVLRQSMMADYDEVDRVGRHLRERLRKGNALHVTTSTGTDLRVEFLPNHRWHLASGVQREAGWTNFPGGELLTSPGSVDGVYVPDGGAWLPDGATIERAARIQLHFERGVLRRMEGDSAVIDQLERAIATSPQARRVGQVAFGTNTGVLAPIGVMLQDLKMPGFHLTLGYPAPDDTGANWTCPVEVPLRTRRPDVAIDETLVMVRGKYVAGIL
ncbi:MAG: aminopeptidase [Myxococcota bacterium]